MSTCQTQNTSYKIQDLVTHRASCMPIRGVFYCKRIMRQNYSKIVGALSTLVLAGLPLVAWAQIDLPGTELEWSEIFRVIRNIAYMAIPVIFAIGLIIFLWGLLMFLRAAGDESAADEGKRRIVWGVIIMFVMVSVWGLVGIIVQLVGIQPGQTPTLPTVPPAR